MMALRQRVFRNMQKRSFSAAAAPAVASKGGAYNVVKFEAEDPDVVASEVPDFAYYRIPGLRL